ncbi:MAG: sugar transferase [Candidatus Neomarinimicrobiota bacterium]
MREPILKRPLDILFATIGLILSAPLWGIISLLIYIKEGPPIFYSQKRWGRNGVQFDVLKFRTIVPGSDEKYGIWQATENDHHITPLGRVLRAAGLDELPQILNILRGQMSLVGPRALAVGESVQDKDGLDITYEEIPGFTERLNVRPGLTSLATIYRPKAIHPEKKFRLDLEYVRRQSFWLDLKLICLSLWISIRGKWESRGKKL